MPSLVRQKKQHKASACASPTVSVGSYGFVLSQTSLLREAILLSFCDPLPRRALQQLQSASKTEWQRLLRWLDISGLALYFLDRITELQLSHILPPAVLAQLQQKLHENSRRTRGMIDESIAIQQGFQKRQLTYAVLKGFSFHPHAVPKPELRSQFDLDFLIAERSLPEAREILESRGYHLYAVNGRSWEFKTKTDPGSFLKDLYRDLSFRSVELHVESSVPNRRLLLDHIEMREFHGIRTPVLSPVDLFLGHGLHVYRHVSSEFSRASHLLEFYRHVITRRNDGTFWEQLQSMNDKNPRAFLGLGVITLLATRVMGEFAPEAFTKWTVDRLPDPVKLWVEMYGYPAALKSLPGSMSYVLLQKELERAGMLTKISTRQLLLPSRWPGVRTWAVENENLSAKFRRRRRQLHFIFRRASFHIVEGSRYLWKSYLWQQQRNGVQR